MIGKFILGRPTDYFGGQRAMVVTLLSSSVCLFGCSISKNIETFGIFWILFSFIFSAAWGAIGKIVRDKFPKKDWAFQLGIIYTGSRLGSMLSQLLFGNILRQSTFSSAVRGAWRPVFLVSSGILAAVTASSIFLRQLVVSSSSGTDFQGAESSKTTIGKNDQGVQSLPTSFSASAARYSSASSSMSVQSVLRTSVESQLKDRRAESVPEVLARLVHDETFWLILASRISFVSVRQFSAYLPFYLTTVYGIAASSAASTAASFAVSSWKFCNVFDKAIYIICEYFDWFLYTRCSYDWILTVSCYCAVWLYTVQRFRHQDLPAASRVFSGTSEMTIKGYTNQHINSANIEFYLKKLFLLFHALDKADNSL